MTDKTDSLQLIWLLAAIFIQISALSSGDVDTVSWTWIGGLAGGMSITGLLFFKYEE
jgi:hypothetical protein